MVVYIVVYMLPDEPRVCIAFTCGRTRNTSSVVSVRFAVARGPETVMDEHGDVPPAPAAANALVNAINLPREALKLDKFEGRKTDRRFAASWLLRNERIHELLGYDDSDDFTAKKLALASASLPSTSAAGQWFDSQQNTPATRFDDWESFKTAFLKRFGPTPTDLRQFEQDFQRLTQGSESVSEFVQRIDKERDFLAAHQRTFDDITVRNVLIAGLRKILSSHVSSVLTLRPDADYETCVEVANSHPEADSRAKPRLQVFRTNPPRRNESRTRRAPEQGNRSDKYCVYHRGNCGFNTDDCPAVRRLKAAGKWRSKAK
jgi:hypothetical protein